MASAAVQRAAAADSSVRTRSPSRVPVRMWALDVGAERVLALDGEADQRVAVCEFHRETEPTLIPDTVTSLPTLRPPASVNIA